MIFVSYSKKDRDFANKLADDLESAGFQVWIDRSIGGGENWRETIESSLKESKEVIIVVSPNSMESDWVRHEGSLAYGWGKKLYPILIATVKSLPPWLEEYQWVSFVNVPYAIALNSLVAALTPPNPMQDLLDEQVNAHHQTGQLLGEEILHAVNQALDTLVISPEAVELIQKSTKAIEGIQQREMEQKRALQEAETKQYTTRKRSRNVIILLILAFITLTVVSILSTIPVSTGWQKLSSFDNLVGSGNSSGRLLVTLDADDSDIIYISNYLPGGFYKSTFDEKTCWKKIEPISGQQTIVTHIAANKDRVYIVSSGGMFSSNDGGNTWRPLNLPDQHNTQEITALAVNPSESAQAFIAVKTPQLFVTENGGTDWSPAIIPSFADETEILALAHNGSDLLLATSNSIWINRESAADWDVIFDKVSPLYGLSMLGHKGRFFVAQGDMGIGDADIDSKLMVTLADSPPVATVYSISASDTARYISSEGGVWYWRLWYWTNIKNWLLTNLGRPIPCY